MLGLHNIYTYSASDQLQDTISSNVQLHVTMVVLFFCLAVLLGGHQWMNGVA